MRKSGSVYPFRGRADSTGSVSDMEKRKVAVVAVTADDVPSTSFVKRRQFLFLNLKKRSSLQDDNVRGRNSISLPVSPKVQATSVFYQSLEPDPPQRPLR